MKQTIDTFALVFMSVLLSSLTVYGALGIDPTASSSPLVHHSK